MDPVLSELKVPCVCEYERDTGPFRTYPDRHRIDPTALELDTPDSLTESQFTMHLQNWLCFGLIREICQLCRVHFHPSDLVIDERGSRIISYAKLEQYIWYWCGAGHTIAEKEWVTARAEFCELLYIANKVVNTRINRLSSTITGNEGVILLSIMALVDYLVFNHNHIFDIPTETMAAISWTRSPTMDRLLLNSGWCRGELPILYSKCSPIILLYHATLRRTRQDKNHSRCTDVACYANQIEDGMYKPSHDESCRNMECEMITAPVQAICEVLLYDGIPVVRVVEGPYGPIIELDSFNLGELGELDTVPPYVAISHVWSDGMGNPTSNSMHVCQLRRIQGHANALNPTAEGGSYFWMDTLCVPLETGVRNLAISRMARTYAHSTNVLVLDKWLESSTVNRDPRECLIRMGRSNWNQRLWTYQEAKLARDCRFQLLSGAVTFDEFSGEKFLNEENHKRVVDHLLSLDESDFFRFDYLVVLLKGALPLDELTTARVDEYANLPEGGGQEEEELRIMAIGAAEHLRLKAKLRQTISPLIEKLGNRYVNTRVDPRIEGMLNSPRDPVFSYGLSILGPLRGVFFRYTMDRGKDMNPTEISQFTGHSSPPHQIFREVVQGLKGRMTSRREDETICIGGIIGLDVSRMLKFSVDKKKRAEQTEQVCATRMQEFYLALKEIGSDVLFWNVPRLQDPGFSWAPRSFMNLGSEQAYGRPATITRSGLFVQLGGISLGCLSLADLLAKPVIHVDTDLRQIFFRHDKTFYMQPPDFDPAQTRELGLVTASSPTRKAFVAEIVKRRGPLKLIRYILHAELIDGVNGEDYVYIKGIMNGGEKFCIV